MGRHRTHHVLGAAGVISPSRRFWGTPSPLRLKLCAQTHGVKSIATSKADMPADEVCRKHAPLPARPCAGPTARGGVGGLQRHDLRRHHPGNRNQAQGPLSKMAAQKQSGRRQPEGSGRSPVLLADFPPSRWKSIRATNAIECLREGFIRRTKTQTVLPGAETATMLVRTFMASGQIVMRKAEGWATLSEKPSDQINDLAA